MASTSWSDYFKFLPQGAIIQEFKVGDKSIVLGFQEAEHYQADYSPFLGETIGRCANRIAGAKIQRLNGRSYELAANNGPNTLHGGVRGWGKKEFRGMNMVTRDGREAVEFTYNSAAGEEGFPGEVELNVWYYPSVQIVNGKQSSALEIEYEATLVGGGVEETIINVCNHSYFNIANSPTIEGTDVILHTNMHQVVDDTNIPTGVIEPFPGIVAGKTFTLGAREPDIDHCFIMDDKPESIPLDTRTRPLQKLCEMRHSDSKIHFEVHSTEPAFQFYTGQHVDVPELPGHAARGARSGICVEASRYVNAINDDRWRSMVVLKSGQRYGSRTIYRATQLD